jgi:hypothetical protein
MQGSVITPGDLLIPLPSATSIRAHARPPRFDRADVQLEGWRRFAGSRFRPFHGVGFSQGAVNALAGATVTTPLMLALGGPPAFVLVASVLPGLGSLSQLALPWLLRKTDGNLRGLTVLIAVLGDTRGFWYAGIVALAAAGWLPHGVALAAIVVLSIAVGAIGSLSGSNLLAWYHAVLPEPERRFVSPRTGVVAAVAATAVLIPTAVLLHDVHVPLGFYVVPLLVAGISSLVGIAGLLRLPRPGRVRVPDSALVSAERPPAIDRFVRISTFGAIGAGLGPPLSIYALVVLGLSPGFTIALSAIATLASLVASMVIGSLLDGGSASRVLRFAHGIRAVAMAIGLLAFPGNPLAAELLILVAIMGAAGDGASGLAWSERILRLSVGPAAIAHQARYVAATSAACAGAQLAASGVLAAGSALGYPVYAALFVASGAIRTVTAARLDVTPREPITHHAVAAPSPALGN